MKIVLVSVGTDGDVRPMIALGRSLQEKGHEIVFCAPVNNEELVSGFGLDFHPIDINMKEILGKDQKVFSRQSIRVFKRIRELSEEMIARQITGLFQSCKGADCLIGSGNMIIGRTVAEYYHIPFYYVFHVPQMIYSQYHPPVIIRWQKLPRFINLLFWKASSFMFNLLWREIINGHRQKSGLNNIKDVYNDCYNKIVLAVDRSLAVIPDVKVDYIRTGYWYLEDSIGLDQGLESFINCGKPVVYIGFGSMTGPSKRSMESIMNAVANKTELRFIISKGWAGLHTDLKMEHVMFVDHVPHSKLFREMAVIVHHGGAGTIHAAARAGKPQIIIPHMIDQFYWGEKVCQLGLGPRPFIRSSLKGKQLMETIENVLKDKEMIKNAVAFGDKLTKEEDGLEEIIRLLGL